MRARVEWCLSGVVRGFALAALVVLGTGQARAQDELPRETIEADISLRQVAVESDFAGARVVLFGTVENSRQTAAEDGLYDIAIVLEGPRQSLTVRRKTHVAGVWINTDSAPYTAVPSYYAVKSTRPVGEIAPATRLRWLGIGFEHLKLLPIGGLSEEEDSTFRKAIVRVKNNQGLYRSSDTGVAFIGSSLFRATFDLPANVSVGEFTATVYLFRAGNYLTSHKTSLVLSRQGFERFIHTLAFEHPFVYGVAAVILAILAGLASTAIFKKRD